MIKVGSLFAGIGGFEKGIEDALGGMAETVWQVEQNSFCQKVLKKHWPNATIFDDVRTVGKHNLEPVHILCGGFPCQSISIAGKMEGLENENKSGLWWEMHRIISELRPRIAILENVANVLRVGGPNVVGSLAAIGYDCEWTIIRASDFGAPHRRARWFCVSWDSRTIKNERWIVANTNQMRFRTQNTIQSRGQTIDAHDYQRDATNTNSQRSKKQSIWSQSMEKTRKFKCGSSQTARIRSKYWQRFPTQSPVCRRNDGVSNRVDRIAALGNAIVPQCSEWVARQVLNSGLLDDLLEEK